MPNLATHGSICQCSFGTLPSVVSVAPASTGAAMSMKVLTEMMIVSNTNIAPFGLCGSLGNPAVASATSANLGVLTPQGCTPSVVAPWAPASAAVTILGQKAATVASTCTCAFGGTIAFVQTPNAVATSM